MKVILLKDVPKVGQRYDIKDVAEGYAVNSLIPRGLAEAATPQTIARIEKKKAEDLTQKKIQEELLLKNLETIKKLKIELSEKANDKGHLFAGVTREAVAAEIHKATRFAVDPASVRLDKPLKETGEHKVVFEVLGKKAEFIVSIAAK
jgi:large subunit ribosomal protein L9